MSKGSKVGKWIDIIDIIDSSRKHNDRFYVKAWGYYSSSFIQVQRIGNDVLSRKEWEKVLFFFLKNRILFILFFLCLLLSFPLWAGSG